MIDLIKNWESVKKYVGNKPTLGDCEVVDIKLDCSDTSISFRVSVAYYKKNDVAFDLKFYKIESLELNGFNHQNVILEFNVEKREDGLSVEIVPTYGLSARFVCGTAELVNLDVKDK